METKCKHWLQLLIETLRHILKTDQPLRSSFVVKFETSRNSFTKAAVLFGNQSLCNKDVGFKSILLQVLEKPWSLVHESSWEICKSLFVC